MASNSSPDLQALSPDEQRNLAAVADVLPFWNCGDIHGVLAFYDENILWTNVSMEETYSGKDEVGGYLQRMLTAFPDLSFQVMHKIPRGHRIAERWVISGTHLGPYLGIPPTGRHVDIHGMSIVHLPEGRFVSDRFYFDSSSVLRSMGLFPPASALRSAAGAALLAVAAQAASAVMPEAASVSTSFAPVVDDTPLSSQEQSSMAVVLSAIDAFNDGRYSLVAELLADDIAVDNKTVDASQQGKQSATQSLHVLADGFPDARIEIVQSLVRDQAVACEFRLAATHLGPFLGIPPSGREINLPGISMITVRDGQIVDMAIYADSGMLWRQLGLMPPLTFLSTSVARVSLWIAVNRVKLAAIAIVLAMVIKLTSRRERKSG